jgi:malic enzyme|tara:strand:+ start:156 stop:287 length:132 start_codon:yes stop_codon:yes gene_type:complete
MSTEEAKTPEQKQAELKQAAFDYHEFPRPGKYEVVTIKKMDNA